MSTNDICQAFNLSSLDDDKLIQECAEVCRIYNISPADLFYQWEAMSYGNKQRLMPRFDMESLSRLKVHLKRDLDNKSKVKVTGLVNVASRRRVPPHMKSNIASSSKFVKQEKIQEDLAGVAFTRIDESQKTSQRAYKYMYETIRDRGEALDDILDDFCALVKAHYNITELGDPAASTDESVTAVGRIVIDVDSVESSDVKLNEAVLAIESSRAMGQGARVPLRFAQNFHIRGCVEGAGGVGLFPGAIVALQGKNGGGGWFLVEEILALPPVLPVTKGTLPSAFIMAVANGPFTPDGDLKYKSWKALLNRLTIEKPKVLLLGGPFIDLNHPRLQEDDIDKSINELFKEHFIEPVHEFLSASLDSIVIVVPSVQDAISHHNVFPQAQLDSRLSNHHRLHMLPNPCHFSINGVVFASSTVDTLFHLRKEELYKRGPEISPIPLSGEPTSDAMANLCRHFLQQRSFYPIFPPPAQSSHEINLSVSHWQDMKIDQPSGSAPDVIITSSRLKQISKVVHGTTVINPGHLYKSGYAWLQFGLNQKCEVDFRKLEDSKPVVSKISKSVTD